MIWLMIIIYLLGLSAGYVISDLILKSKVNGSLRVDNSDPDEPPYLFLELKESPEVLKRKKYVTLDVEVKNFISQK